MILWQHCVLYTCRTNPKKTPVPYRTMRHLAQISITKRCIVGYLSNAVLDLWDGSIIYVVADSAGNPLPSRPYFISPLIGRVTRKVTSTMIVKIEHFVSILSMWPYSIGLSIVYWISTILQQKSWLQKRNGLCRTYGHPRMFYPCPTHFITSGTPTSKNTVILLFIKSTLVCWYICNIHGFKKITNVTKQSIYLYWHQ